MTPEGCTRTAAATPSHEAWDWPVLPIIGKTLPNGLRVILAENRTVPLVWLSWVSRAGFEWDPPELAGMAAMTPPLIREGTARRSAGQIAQDLDDLGADLVVGCDWDSAFLNLELLSCDLAAGAGLLLDMACFAQFPHAAVARHRQRRLAELERRRREPRTLADEEIARAIHGDGGYGRPPLGAPTTVRRIDAPDLAMFHQARYGPATSCLVLAGSFDGDEAEDLLGSFELPPPFPREERLPLQLIPIEPATGIRVVDIPNALQTELRVGHTGIARASRDLPALQVLNTVLGDGPTSRLAESLRQRLGLTYHIRSRFAVHRHGGTFVVSTGVATESAGAALEGIAWEIGRLREELVPQAELEIAKRRLLGIQLRRFQSILGTGGTLSHMALDGDPLHDLDRRRREIGAVEPEGLRELARRHLHPERLAVVAVGPAETLQTQFSDGAASGRQPSLAELSS